MWKQILQLFKKETLCDEAFKEALIMLEASAGMFRDAVASLRSEGSLDLDIYSRDRQLNEFERDVRRKIVTHLAVSSAPDANMGLVLTAIVMDIERIGDYTKNIVELAAEVEYSFTGGEIEAEISQVENTVSRMFEKIAPALRDGDVETARAIFAEHQGVGKAVEHHLRRLIHGEVLADDSGIAVTTALYLRYLKRVSAHLKNVATSIVNPYYRIGFREKPEEEE